MGALANTVQLLRDDTLWQPDVRKPQQNPLMAWDLSTTLQVKLARC